MLLLRKFKTYLKKTILFFGTLFAIFFSRNKNNLSFKNVIIVLNKPLGIGDLVMLIPYILSIKDFFPKKEFYLATDYPEIFNIESVTWTNANSISYEKWKNSLVILPDLNLRPNKHIFFSKYLIGYLFSNRIYSNFLRSKLGYSLSNDHYSKRIEVIMKEIGIKDIKPTYDGFSPIEANLLKFHLPKRYICIAPVSNWITRQYSFNKLIEVINLIKDHINIVLIGTKDEKNKFEPYLKSMNDLELINLMGSTSMQEMIMIIKRAEASIANDSGPAHISTIFNQNAFIIFGCCSPESRLPSNTGPIKKVTSFSNGSNCKFYPCFNGLSEPICQNTKKNVCLDINSKVVADRIIKTINV